jgi:hypothetical protein
MNRYHMLAAEIYGYSYANYEDHLGIGNVRYEKLMPRDARTLERAEAEGWPLEDVARKLDVDTEAAAELIDAFRDAREVVDADNPAESFRRAVRQCIEAAISEGLGDKPSIERLVVQICYRAADLAFLLDLNEQPLSTYSTQLRWEPDYDDDEGPD